ncbi:glycosyltransferase family 2 protein [Candidatus Bathyarchaeota archaeon]|jgi:glycosyltransferase involved in cell wall biosynthesis|nr:glycosyltransferase family 2 protein [Candidatus Bathyarchaeota archaeon]
MTAAEETTVSAVIPAYNEEKTIEAVVKGALSHVDEVLVVDDGSTDDTARIAEEAGAKVLRQQNAGVLKATELGLREATCDIIVTLDADGQHDPSEIPRLIEPILRGEADLVMGIRPELPYLSERILTSLTSIRVPIGDASTGFRAVRREIAREMSLYGACLCGTFVLEAHRHGARVAGVPISIKEREGERRIQTRHLRQFFTVLWDVLRV